MISPKTSDEICSAVSCASAPMFPASLNAGITTDTSMELSARRLWPRVLAVRRGRANTRRINPDEKPPLDAARHHARTPTLHLLRSRRPDQIGVLVQGDGALIVEIVDVVPEMHHAVPGRPSREIHREERRWVGNIHIQPLTGADRLVDGPHRVAVVAQDPRHQ